MTNRITGCGNSDGEYIDIEPVEYVRDQCQYQLVKRIAELEAQVANYESDAYVLSLLTKLDELEEVIRKCKETGSNESIEWMEDIERAIK